MTNPSQEASRKAINNAWAVQEKIAGTGYDFFAAGYQASEARLKEQNEAQRVLLEKMQRVLFHMADRLEFYGEKFNEAEYDAALKDDKHEEGV